MKTQPPQTPQTKMSFESFMQDNIPVVDAALESYISLKVDQHQKVLLDAITYSLLAKAKRIRPLMTLASQRMFDTNPEKILPLACAIEMVHAYSLIHDDLPAMDDDDFRRGQPSCHKQFGEDIAILAGDSLNTYCFEILARDLPQFYSAEKTLFAIQHLAISCGLHGMAGGQAMDLRSGATHFDEDTLKRVHSLKTGAILSACVTLPATLENADPEELVILSDYGATIGLLFQIVDDILDVKSSQAVLGKSPQKDLEQNKLTYVTLWGLEKAESIAKEESEKAMQTLSLLKGRDTSLLEAFTTYILERTN